MHVYVYVLLYSVYKMHLDMYCRNLFDVFLKPYFLEAYRPVHKGLIVYTVHATLPVHKFVQCTNMSRGTHVHVRVQVYEFCCSHVMCVCCR